MAKSPTYKPEIFLYLFRKRWDAATQLLSNPVVYGDEIRQEHADYRYGQGERVEVINVYNFMKDFVRNIRLANKKWPSEISEAGYTARQVTGDGKVFEFISILPGQTEPFPITAPVPPPDIEPHQISSVSLPLASRRLGRPDEPWLVQVSVRLHVVETYFALFSARTGTIRQIDHLQNALKLRKTEIDALFLGTEEIAPDEFQEFMITCEAKRVGEDIISEQVLAQVKAVFHLNNVTQPFVVPIALKSISPSRIHIVEYNAVLREDAEALETLSLAGQAVFELIPAVPGIGVKSSSRKVKGSPKRNERSRPVKRD